MEKNIQNVIESWSHDYLLRAEARKKIISEKTNLQLDEIPDDVGLCTQTIRDLRIDDLYNYYGGIVRGYTISKNKIKYFEGPITHEMLLEERPLYILIKVLEYDIDEDESERGAIKDRMILKCGEYYFQNELQEAKNLALERARKELELN